MGRQSCWLPPREGSGSEIENRNQVFAGWACSGRRAPAPRTSSSWIAACVLFVCMPIEAGQAASISLGFSPPFASSSPRSTRGFVSSVRNHWSAIKVPREDAAAGAGGKKFGSKAQILGRRLRAGGRIGSMPLNSMERNAVVEEAAPPPPSSAEKKFGSSLAERRKKSAPIARGIGLRLVLLGKPCSGKGTQAPMICRKYRIVHISVGDLLRAEVRIGSELGVKAGRMMKEGSLLPDDIVNEIVARRLEQDDCIHNGWILDGYPRTRAQAQALEDLGITPDAVIVLDRPDQVVREWCSGRKTDPTTGVIYHPKYNPCPLEIQPYLVTREDDNPEVIERRLQQFDETREELLSVYGVAVHQVDTNRHELDAFKDICQTLDHFCPSDDVDVMPVEVNSLRMGVMRGLDRERGVVTETGKKLWNLIDIVRYCNTHEMEGFMPVFSGEKRIGYIGKSVAAELFNDPGFGYDFHMSLDSCSVRTGQTVGGYLYLAPNSKTAKERTEVTKKIVERLSATGIIRGLSNVEMIEGLDDEAATTSDRSLLPAPQPSGPPQSLSSPPRSSMRRASEEIYLDVFEMMRPRKWDCEGSVMQMAMGADTFFGVPLYGVHVNGIVRGDNGVDSIWVARRSSSKVLYPGLFDQMVSHHQGSRRGGTYVWSRDGSFMANTILAAQREAALELNFLKSSLRSSGLVSYRYETALGLVTKVLHVYDLEVSSDWRPFNGNGEIDGFKLMTIPDVIEDMKSHPDRWKPNSMLVNIDLAIRRGYITPDHPDYLEIVHDLRVSDQCQDWAQFLASDGS